MPEGQGRDFNLQSLTRSEAEQVVSEARVRVGRERKRGSLGTTVEMHAAVAENVEEGELLAVNHSILKNKEASQVRSELEYNVDGNEKLWVNLLKLLDMPISMVAEPYKAVLATWHLYKKKRNPDTKLDPRVFLGPKILNKLLGILIDELYGQFREGVTTSRALDIVYSINLLDNDDEEKRDDWGRQFLKFVLNLPEAQAVRNRLRLTYAAMLEEMERITTDDAEQKEAGKENEPIRICSLACGSAQASVEAMASFMSKHPDKKVELTLVDLNGDSLNLAKRLAHARGIDVDDETVFKTRSLTINEFLREQAAQGIKYDIMEMVGFLDYREEDEFVELLNNCRLATKKGGLFIGAQLAPSPRQKTLQRLMNWPLLKYRSQQEVEGLLAMSSWDNSHWPSRDEFSLSPDSLKNQTSTLHKAKFNDPAYTDDGFVDNKPSVKNIEWGNKMKTDRPESVSDSKDMDMSETKREKYMFSALRLDEKNKKEASYGNDRPSYLQTTNKAGGSGYYNLKNKRRIFINHDVNKINEETKSKEHDRQEPYTGSNVSKFKSELPKPSGNEYMVEPEPQGIHNMIYCRREDLEPIFHKF